MSVAKGRVEELIELSRVTQKMTFQQKLKLMEETSRLLKKGRPMKEVLQLSDEARRRTR